MGVLLILTSSCKKKDDSNSPPASGTVTDIEGNVYHFVTIGTQVWMVENLKTTKYRNGDSIPNIIIDTAWSNLTTGAYCNYNNDVNIATTYGRLYNWFAVSDSRNIAPNGWHVPTDEEWATLTTYLGGENVAGGKLKETSTIHWNSPNNGATNETGFTALPGGICSSNETFSGVGLYGYWWSFTPYSSSMAWSRNMYFGYISITRHYDIKVVGLSVRCIRD